MYTCQHCETKFQIGITYRAGIHLQLDCPECGKFVKYLPQDIRPAECIVSFGKHSGRTIEEIYAINPGYIHWLSENVSSKYFRRVTTAYLQSLPGAEPVKPPEQQTLDFGNYTDIA